MSGRIWKASAAASATSARWCNIWSLSVRHASNDRIATSVNVHEHKLSRPQKKVGGLSLKQRESLRERTRGSLIPDTLAEMSSAEKEQQEEVARSKMSRISARRSLDLSDVPQFTDFCKEKLSGTPWAEGNALTTRRVTEILQVNIGLFCNQACSHCHVESSPKRKDEMMKRKVAEKVLELLQKDDHVHTLDLTGGAPELNSQFRFLAGSAATMGKNVIVRSNLTALLEPGFEDTPEFLAANKIRVVASLPCYSAKNVNLQRGKGVFQKSIQALLTLNDLGYGIGGSGLELDLVYNPLGAFLPPDQRELEAKYRVELREAFGLEFSRLFAMTNMPVKRFADFLYRRGELEAYMSLLVSNFNPSTLSGIMCRNLLSVSYDGTVYDCDFNQQLALPVMAKGSRPLSVLEMDHISEALPLTITMDRHCFGCAAGSGST